MWHGFLEGYNVIGGKVDLQPCISKRYVSRDLYLDLTSIDR